MFQFIVAYCFILIYVKFNTPLAIGEEMDYLIIDTDIGLVPLTDTKQIAIYNLLKEKHIMNYNGIASSINVPSSTLKYILLKLQESHVITKEPGDRGRYSLSGRLILHQNDDSEPAVLDYRMRELVATKFNNFAFSNYISLYAKYMGIDLKIIWQIYADYIRTYTQKMIPKGSVDDVIKPIMDLFKRLCVGFNVVLFRSKPLIIVFYGPCDNLPFIKACIELFQMWLEYATGMSYSKEFDHTRCDSYHITIKFINECMILMPAMPKKLHSGVKTEFIMISLNNRTYVVDNLVQIKILRIINSNPKTMTELVNESELPRSTITMNVRKLVENEIITSVHNSKKVAFYILNCNILLDGDGIECDCGGIGTSIENSLEISGFTGGFGQFFIQSMRCMGVNCDKMMLDIGSNIITQKEMIDWEFNNFYATICDIGVQMGIDIQLKKTSPMTFSIGFETSYMKKPLLFLIVGMINRSMEIMTYSQHSYEITMINETLCEVIITPNKVNFIDYDLIIKKKMHQPIFKMDREDLKCFTTKNQDCLSLR